MVANPKETEIKYIVISPVRNEERYIEKTLHSMVLQTIRPLTWVIVDDGSTDRTVDIVESFIKEYDFIRLLRRDPHAKAQIKSYDGLAQASEIKAFNFGLSQIKDIDFDYVAKIDGDISFANDYFETLLAEFVKDEQLGIASGHALTYLRGKLVSDKIAESTILHAACVYRKQCLEDIGGLTEVLGWDTIDELSAQMNGWRTENLSDLTITHWRLMGAVTGIVRGKIRHGFTAYLIGYHPLYMLARSIKRMVDEPYIIGGLSMFWGFCLGYIRHDYQITSPEMRRFLRSKQIKKLLGRNVKV